MISDFVLLEGSNKWTPKKWGLYPPKWGVPLKVTYNMYQPTCMKLVRIKYKTTSKARGMGSRKYLRGWNDELNSSCQLEATSQADERFRWPQPTKKPTILKKPNCLRSAETLERQKQRLSRTQATNTCNTCQLKEVNAGFNWKLGAGHKRSTSNGVPKHISTQG